MSVKTNLGRVGLVPRGEYDGESSYRRLDFISYEGSSYVAIRDTQGIAPNPEHVFPVEGAAWAMLAARGNQGRDGERGEPGKDGKSYVILGPVYSTEEALRQAVTSPNEGDRYEVGDAPPYDVYRATGEPAPNDWVNEGTLTGGGGGADLSDETPQPLGKASPGTSKEAARADHVHETPSADDVGALHPDPDDEGELGDPLPINADLLGGVSLAELMLRIYPVGSVYISANALSPAELFGGKWERIKGRFLLGADDETYTVGSEGGEASIALTEKQMAAHTHGEKSLSGSVQIRKGVIGSTEYAIISSASGIVSSEETGDGAFNPIQLVSGNSYPRSVFKIDATHEHSVVGEGEAHNNMPPYLAVYMWERIA